MYLVPSCNNKPFESQYYGCAVYQWSMVWCGSENMFHSAMTGVKCTSPFTFNLVLGLWWYHGQVAASSSVE